MNIGITGISSMATRQVLAELAAEWQQRLQIPVSIESVGGVDAARRVQAGESFDVVILASDALAKLAAAGFLVADSRVDLMKAGIAVAVRAGEAQPDIGTEEALRRAVLAAPSVGYSTGPSGVALVGLFERWGIADEIRSRMIQAPAGIPVGTMVARGDVALGFQQFSELMHLEGIALVGPLPAAVQITTTFSGALCTGSQRASEVRQMLAFMASSEAAEARRRHGMDPA
jgi:molybdate transport system substrate-binding protein